MSKRRIFAAAGIAIAMLQANPAQAEVLTFKVDLDGVSMPVPTGSTGSGKARVTIDTAKQLVSVDMNVQGIAIDDLWDTLVANPIGPVHFHKYGSHQHHADDVVLILPVPFGPSYQKTAHGFRIVTKNYDYAAGAKLLGSLAPFDDFVAAMKAGQVVLNVHTDKFHDGEIAGTVTTAGGSADKSAYS